MYFNAVYCGIWSHAIFILNVLIRITMESNFYKKWRNYLSESNLNEYSSNTSIIDLVSEAEDIVQNIRSNMSTNSVLQQEEKMDYLRAFDELLDKLSDIGLRAEME